MLHDWFGRFFCFSSQFIGQNACTIMQGENGGELFTQYIGRAVASVGASQLMYQDLIVTLPLWVLNDLLISNCELRVCVAKDIIVDIWLGRVWMGAGQPVNLSIGQANLWKSPRTALVVSPSLMLKLTPPCSGLTSPNRSQKTTFIVAPTHHSSHLPNPAAAQSSA